MPRAIHTTPRAKERSVLSYLLPEVNRCLKWGPGQGSRSTNSSYGLPEYTTSETLGLCCLALNKRAKALSE